MLLEGFCFVPNRLILIKTVSILRRFCNDWVLPTPLFYLTFLINVELVYSWIFDIEIFSIVQSKIVIFCFEIHVFFICTFISLLFILSRPIYASFILFTNCWSTQLLVGTRSVKLFFDSFVACTAFHVTDPNSFLHRTLNEN